MDAQAETARLYSLEVKGKVAQDTEKQSSQQDEYFPGLRHTQTLLEMRLALGIRSYLPSALITG